IGAHRPRAFEVPADVRLDRRRGFSRYVVDDTNSRREILVTVDAACWRDDDGVREKPRRPFTLFGEPAHGSIEAQRALEREAIVRALCLNEQAVPCGTR